MKALLAAALAAGSAVVIGGQDLPRRDARFQNLAVQAASTPPEFEADALLRISSASSVDDRWRKDLLELAFMRAYGAQESYRRIAFGVSPDSRQGAMAAALDSRLTQVSLQTRATQLMALVDPQRARELFQWIPAGIERTPCEDELVPAIGEYYTTLSQLARTAFGAGERGDAVRFLEYYLWRAHLPSEMPGVALAIQRFRATAEEAPYLQLVLRFIFEGATRDPRGFSVAGIDLVEKVGDLDEAHQEIGVTGTFLVRALRAYLRDQLTGPRCGDSASEPVAAETFNARIRRTRAVQDGVPPLDGADVRPSRVLSSGRVDMLWQSGEARRLQMELGALRGSGRNPIPEAQRRQDRWRQQADQFVADVDRWSGARENAAVDHFYEKSLLFTGVLNLMPPGASRTRAIRAFIDFLRHTDMDRVRRPLWFLFTNQLLQLAHGSDRYAVLDAMEMSGQPTLSLYARLERLLPEQTRPRPGPVGPRLGFAEQGGHP